MKRIFLALLLMVAIGTQAQKNVFLDPAFWRNAPDVNTVKEAIANGNDPAAMNASSFDGVVYAINAKAPAATIKFMLDQKGNDVNKITHDSRTYIFWASSRGDLEVISYILEKGARLDVQDSRGTSPMGFAAAGGQTDARVYDMLIKAGADIQVKNADGANLLLTTIASDKDLKMTEYFISKGLSLQSTDAAGNTAFDYAARSGNLDLLKKLLDKGVKFTDNAMLMAAQGGRGTNHPLSYFQALEAFGVKATAINANGENALHMLARKPGQIEMMSYFMSKGVDINKADLNGNTPLILAAASNRDTATIRFLLNNTRNINAATPKGVTALAQALRGNSLDVVNMLLAKKADLTFRDKDGNTAAFYLLQSYNAQRKEEFEQKAALLMQQSVALNVPQNNGNTLYHLAVTKLDLPLLEQLAKFKIDVNAKNKEGMTALHKAAMVSKDDSILKYLLSIGAKKEITTQFDETALDLAKENESFTRNKIALNFLQ